MNTSAKSALKSLLQRTAWLLFAVAGLAFWGGGRAISEFTKTERLLAEIEDIGLAFVGARVYGEDCIRGFCLRVAPQSPLLPHLALW